MTEVFRALHMEYELTNIHIVLIKCGSVGRSSGVQCVCVSVFSVTVSTG